MRLQAPALPLFCRHAVAAADVFVFVWAAVTAFILIVGQVVDGTTWLGVIQEPQTAVCGC